VAQDDDAPDDSEEPTISAAPSPPGAPYRSIGGGGWVPLSFVAIHQRPGHPPARIEAFIAADGVPVVRRVTVTVTTEPVRPIEVGDELLHWSDRPSTYWQEPTPDELRLPLKRVVARALEALARTGEVAPPGTDARQGQRFSNAFANANAEATGPAPRRRRLTPEKLAGVADVVRRARAAKKPIRRAVAEEFGPMSQLTARNWIAASRKAGYLDDEDER
jgi:hypothetical protein